MNGTTILVIDDEPQLRRAMKATLSSIAYAVVEVKTGEEALAVLDELRPDLILLDLNMPGIGGLETCRSIRERSDVPIIILSVRNNEIDKVHALDATRMIMSRSLLAFRNYSRAFARQCAGAPPATAARR